MSIFAPPPKPKTQLGWHRILSPTANVKVSPIAIGGISFGNGWSELFGKSEDAFKLLDTFYEAGGNFIDTANHYNAEESEKLIGEWMELRGVRDQMVVATKFGGGLKSHDREGALLQSNYSGPSAKSMHISVRESLKKLKTDYIDILYVHWWDVNCSVEEVMRGLHALVMAKQVLYLGASDIPAWVVVKANAYARHNGLTPFSIYQGRWNAAYRDMESEIVPMCEDQGMAIASWASLGGGQLTTKEQREKLKTDPNAGRGFYEATENDIKVCEVLEDLANRKNATLQDIALAYLFHQSTYVFPIVGVQTVEHVKAIPNALNIQLSNEEIDRIHNAAPFDPLFPNTFLFANKGYNTRLTAADQTNYQMTTWINAPPKQQPYAPRS
ncbi:NADP-dependent oxidoreductase domain-containing protein [Boeremia exigua]|uniref:NADP-dependent oxidoreductase domain-containing protein n=1 Tax=Boeremia exigua TaxID=749465 RepID=UPI001E8D5B82|nr:NADP-dependent oxidoreductase domain-containing protein [Boeremia exigua]KAH6616475.1 NADP-dependent oxidoreductase domain-containing protein [Boeremia exigua]